MKCPFCKSELIPGELQSYETLSEHVCDPNNEEIFLRSTFICNCSIAENCFWDPDGAFYLGDVSKGHLGLIMRIKHTGAIGSFEEQLEKDLEEKYNEQY